MKIDKINNLLELFFEKYKKQNSNDVFLQSLDKNRKLYTWGDVYKNTIKFLRFCTYLLKTMDKMIQMAVK